MNSASKKLTLLVVGLGILAGIAGCNSKPVQEGPPAPSSENRDRRTSAGVAGSGSVAGAGGRDARTTSR